MKCAVLCFLVYAASSGITVTPARFSPVHLFFFQIQSGEVCSVVFLIVSRNMSSPGERQIWCGTGNMTAHCQNSSRQSNWRNEWFKADSWLFFDDSMANNRYIL